MIENSRTVEQIADLATRHSVTVAVAESLTCGNLAAALGAGPGASEWLRGGVVAYASGVKFEVLGVTPGPVVTAECAEQMARGVARLLHAEATVAATGVGGPEPEEGQPPGTVYVAGCVRDQVRCHRLDAEGDPAEVLAQTTADALTMLLDLLREVVDPSSPRIATR